jgi:kumamolisin
VNQPSVISISWGASESQWTPQALTQFDEAFQAAGAMGVTVCAASGDNGSSDGINDGQDHVDFPASSSFVLGCGGTTLQASNGQIVNETVWNNPMGGATGGGVSNVFPLPAWQQNFNVPPPSGASGGRGVPDVAGDADPGTGYNILVDGQRAVFGGTSAVAPLWAGLIAILNQQMGKPIGFLNPLIYQQAVEAAAFHDISEGSNGTFTAAPGWDPCTGLGSPDGNQLLGALTGKQPQPMAERLKAKKTVAA